METKINYQELMNAKPLTQLTPDFKDKIKFGTLIGFKGLGEARSITAAYPVWSHVGDEIQFILFTRDNGKHCIDNTWLTSRDLFINTEPIIVDVSVKGMPSTFTDEVTKFFNE